MSDALPPAPEPAMVTVSAPHSLDRRRVSTDDMTPYLEAGWSIVHPDHDDPATWSVAPEGGWSFAAAPSAAIEPTAST